MDTYDCNDAIYLEIFVDSESEIFKDFSVSCYVCFEFMTVIRWNIRIIYIFFFARS